MTTPILLVEDDPGAQDLVRALCEHRGYEVDVAADGFSGLRLLSERRHAVVLIDYHLPEMDGYALARLMREIGGGDPSTRLVGITADAHGLASRRGADTLFDAILVKPIVPDALFSTLDRLTRTEPAVPRSETPADALWRRRGLPHRPRAVLCPPTALAEAAAVSQAFDLVTEGETCDLVLVASEAGLDHLRVLRAADSTRLVPAIDLTGRLGPACDLGFAVADAASWSALAALCTKFARRRAALTPAARTATDAAGHLLALLHVADRTLLLPNAAATAPAYETGQPPGERMAAVVALMQAGFLTCDPVADGLLARLTEAGHRALRAEPEPEAMPSLSTAAALQSIDKPPGETRDHVAPVGLPDSIAPVVNDRTVADLRRLIGEETVSRLHERLIVQAAGAFAQDAARSTIAHDAHVLIAMSGTLGFERLSLACRSLQTAISRNEGIDDCLSRAKAACVEMQTWKMSG